MWRRVPSVITMLVTGCIIASTIVLIVTVSQSPDYYLDEGYEAGKIGIPPDACPYPNTDRYEGKHIEWKKGWQKGYLERKELTK